MISYETTETQIKKYWEDPNTISLVDKNLRHLEESFVLPHLKNNYSFADFGCGDGTSTAIYAKRVKKCVALEQSEHLFSKSVKRFKKSRLINTSLFRGNVVNPPCFKKHFDVILTQRVLINLPTWNVQKRAIKKIHSNLKPGGIYLMIENTIEGHNALNMLRQSLGLKAIPIHWHNLFFRHDKLIKFINSLFTIKEHHTFDLYYLLTRAYTSSFLKIGGFGKNIKKDSKFNVADASAAKIFELMGKSVKFNNMYSFGPIQGFVLKKRGR